MHWVCGAEWEVVLPTVLWTQVLLGGAVVFAVVSLRGGGADRCAHAGRESGLG
jgi:hypothetical protein